jgi:hypothetical protein
MPLNFAVKDNPEKLRVKVEAVPTKKVSIALRKTLDGNLIIQDHQSMNIIIMPEKGKILALPKGDFNQDTYTDQDQMFQFLTNAGVVLPDSIIGGNIYGSLEAKFPTEKKGDEEPLEVVILNISNFLTKDKAEYSVRKKFIDDLEKELLDPDEQESTELGEIPQEKFKGSIPMYGFPTRGIYRYNY